MARFPRGPHGPDEPDKLGDSDEHDESNIDFASLFSDVDDDPDADEPAFPPLPSDPARTSEPPAAVPPGTEPSPAPAPRAASPSYDIPELSMPVPPRPEPEPRGPSTTLPDDGAGSFFWGLTPNDEPDPAVHGADKQEPEAELSSPQDVRTSRGLVPPAVPLAPYIPPVYDAAVSDPEPSQQTEPGVPGRTDAQPETGTEDPGAADTSVAGPAAPGPDVAAVTDDSAAASIQVPTWAAAAPEPDARESDARTTGAQQPSVPPPVAPPSAAPDAAEPFAAEPSAPGPVSPDSVESSAPGTVSLPWLRRSRRRAEAEPEPEQEAAQASAPDAVASTFPWEQPATPDRSAEPQPPTAVFPWNGPVEAADEASSSDATRPTDASWSLFGDLADSRDAEQTHPDVTEDDLRDAGGEDAGREDEGSEDAADARPWPTDAGTAPEPAATPQTDLFAAFAATAATAAIPGASASEAAAFGIPANDDARDTGSPTAVPAAAASAAADEQASAGTGGAASSGAPSSGSPYRRRGGAGHGGSGSGGASDRGGADHDDDGGPSPRAQRIMLIVAAAMLVVLLFVALFIVGRTVSHPVASPTPTPTATKTATPTPTPTPTQVATGPQAPGKHPWNTLRGGECLQPFTTAWADTFDVVDCATPHAGQMVYTGVFSTDPAAAFPGADQLASQINLLCSRPGILNLDAAGQVDDAQMQGTYPVTAKEWKDGQRSYYCFVNRASGQPITGSLAGPGPQ